MTNNPDKHRRRSIRLKNYDYRSAGAYFITICTKDRQHLFGEIIEEEMVLNTYGEIAQRCWQDIPQHFPDADVDEFVIMPNHIHGIIVIHSVGVGARHASPLQSTNPMQQPQNKSKIGTIGTIIGSYKSAVTKSINDRHNSPGNKIWQRNYYERIIRDESELHAIRKYIYFNPMKWELDRDNQENSHFEETANKDIWRDIEDIMDLRCIKAEEKDKPPQSLEETYYELFYAKE